MRKENLQEATQRTLIEGYKNLKESKSKKVEDYDFNKIDSLYNRVQEDCLRLMNANPQTINQGVNLLFIRTANSAF